MSIAAKGSMDTRTQKLSCCLLLCAPGHTSCLSPSLAALYVSLPRSLTTIPSQCLNTTTTITPPNTHTPPGIIIITTIRFDDVKGVDEAKSELEEIVAYLKDPKKFTSLGGKLPKVGLCVCVCEG